MSASTATSAVQVASRLATSTTAGALTLRRPARAAADVKVTAMASLRVGVGLRRLRLGLAGHELLRR